jgi:hypothetical protein
MHQNYWYPLGPGSRQHPFKLGPFGAMLESAFGFGEFGHNLDIFGFGVLANFSELLRD